MGLVTGGVALFRGARTRDRGASQPRSSRDARLSAQSASGDRLPPSRRRDRTLADRLRREIELARRRRQNPTGSTADARRDAPPGVLEKEYIRARIREIVPLVKECYEEALGRDPDLAGKIVVVFRIAGEPGVGGVVESSEFIESDSTITDADMVECVLESMYAAEFVAPAGGGVVYVTYPFLFQVAPDPPRLDAPP